MKTHIAFPLMLVMSLLAVAAMAQTRVTVGQNANSQNDQTVEGRLRLSATEAVINEQRSFKFDPAHAQCFSVGGYQTTCATLIGIGYADKARLTVVGDTVVRLDVLELQQ